MGTTTVLLTVVLPLMNAGEAPEAAQILSRFPVGRIPDTPAVHQALDVLAHTDNRDALSLLQSLQRHEHGAVQQHAEQAEADVATRVLHGLRTADAPRTPDEAALERWVASERQIHDTTPESALRVVAYAAVLTENTVWHKPSIGGLAPVASAEMVRRAEAIELDGHFDAALPLFIDAFMSGNARATRALSDRGVDTDRLSRALASEYAPEMGIPHVSPLAWPEASGGAPHPDGRAVVQGTADHATAVTP